MGKILLLFGAVFVHKDKEYIFLAKSVNGIIYAAEILDTQKTEIINSTYERKVVNSQRIESHPLYCYVILKTEDFKNRMAYLGKTDRDESGYVFDLVDKVIDSDDLKEIKSVIMDENSPVPTGLKELVGMLDE